MDFVATHGTAKENAYSIKKDNFNISNGNSHWCGKGCYFFINGINSSPIETLAELWARDQAFDKNSKSYKYNHYSVLKVKFSIKDEYVFDLRLEDVNRLCNIMRDKVRDDMLSRNRKMNDDALWKYLIRKFEIEIIIKNDYIKFGNERIHHIKSRIPNCTIASIMNPKHCIDVNNIHIMKEGTIL